MQRLQNAFLLLVPLAFCLLISDLHGRWVGHYDFWHTNRLYWVCAFSGLLILTSYGAGLPDAIDRRINALFASIGAAVVAAVGISLAQLVTGSSLLPRSVVLFCGLFSCVWGLIETALTNDLRSRKAEATRVILIGSGSEIKNLKTELEHFPERDARVVAILDPDVTAEKLIESTETQNAQVVVLDRRVQARPEIVTACAELHRQGRRIRTLSLFYEEWLGKVPLSDLELISLMFDIGELHRRYYGRQKRIFDSIAGLIMLVLTIVIAIPIAILNVGLNRGSLFFTQERIGRNGNTFKIHKFRTMKKQADSTQWTRENDNRFTRFGRFLRQSHLDEFPQSLNLVKGDISLVGPRPEQPSYVEALKTTIPFYDFRHIIRPGITGWAQVKFRYASSTEDTREKLQYDFYYLRRQGITLDARIILRTLRAVLLGQGR